jgi:phage-related protein
MEVRHYQTSSGRDVIAEFLRDCSQDIRSDYLDAISLLEKGEILKMPLNRPLNNVYAGLQELRFKDRSGQYRFLYLLKKKDAIYVIHAFKKKTEELPDKEKRLVLKRIKEI